MASLLKKRYIILKGRILRLFCLRELVLQAKTSQNQEMCNNVLLTGRSCFLAFSLKSKKNWKKGTFQSMVSTILLIHLLLDQKRLKNSTDGPKKLT